MRREMAKRVNGHVIWKVRRGFFARDLYVIDTQTEGFRSLEEASAVARTLAPKESAARPPKAKPSTPFKKG